MGVTKKGKAWERRNSKWIIWSFICGLNYIAFFWVGARARYRRWTLFGFLYLVLTIAPAVINAELMQDQGQANILAYISMFAWIASIIHAFLIRKEYLVRREIIVDGEAQDNEAYRSKIRKMAVSGTQKAPRLKKREQGTMMPDPMEMDQEVNKPKYVNKKRVTNEMGYMGQEIAAQIDEGNVKPDRKRQAMEKPSWESDSLIDLNTCAEKELSSLPGISVAKAKKAMQYRKEKGGFSSFDSFVYFLDIEPHFAVQIEKLSTLSEVNADPPRRRGRIVDI